MPRQHHLAKKTAIKPIDLDGEPFISLSPIDRSRQRVNSTLGHFGARADMRIETPMAASVCAFVAQGTGVSIVDPFSPLTFSPEDLVIIPYEPTVNFDFFLIMPEDDRPSFLTQDFNAALREAFQAMS